MSPHPDPSCESKESRSGTCLGVDFSAWTQARGSALVLVCTGPGNAAQWSRARRSPNHTPLPAHGIPSTPFSYESSVHTLWTPGGAPLPRHTPPARCSSAAASDPAGRASGSVLQATLWVNGWARFPSVRHPQAHRLSGPLRLLRPHCGRLSSSWPMAQWLEKQFDRL